MDAICFLELLSYIESDISKQNTPMRLCVPVKERLTCTLRFLATGENFKELNENTKLSPSFLSNAIMEVRGVIYMNLKDTFNVPQDDGKMARDSRRIREHVAVSTLSWSTRWQTHRLYSFKRRSACVL